MPVLDFQTPRFRPPGRWPRKPGPWVVAATVAVAAATWWLGEDGGPPAPDLAAAREAPSTVCATGASDTAAVDLQEPLLTESPGRIHGGEVFSDALLRQGLQYAQVTELVSAIRKGVHRDEFSPDIVQLDDRFSLWRDTLGVVHRFEYHKRGAMETRFVAVRTDGELVAEKQQIELERRVVVVGGQVTDMLWNALKASGEDPARLSVRMVDVFESDIDFMVDPRSGDRFALVVPKLYKDGRFVRYADILAAEYITSRESFQAFRYVHPDGSAGYYDSGGRSLQGMFLKSPLNYRRISSGYSSRRFHPVLKKYTPHHGIDYAASRGTRVWATADGVVTFVGRKGALGKYVEVRHKNGYKTGYGHLSRYARSIAKGATVTQKQVIGYVGQTGRATGPHLHYNFIARDRSGRYRCVPPTRHTNRRVGKPIPAELRADYHVRRDALWALLDQDTGPVVTSLEPASTQASRAITAE